MVKKSQIIFMKGKEEALNRLFNGEQSVFGYLAVGYVANDNGFEDSLEEQDGSSNQYGFVEIDQSEISSYKRVPLQSMNETTYDESTGKVLVKFQATLNVDNIQTSQPINQIAIVDTATPNDAGTKFYSATTFQTFNKTAESSITFVLGFRL